MKKKMIMVATMMMALLWTMTFLGGLKAQGAEVGEKPKEEPVMQEEKSEISNPSATSTVTIHVVRDSSGRKKEVQGAALVLVDQTGTVYTGTSQTKNGTVVFENVAMGAFTLHGEYVDDNYEMYHTSPDLAGTISKTGENITLELVKASKTDYFHHIDIRTAASFTYYVDGIAHVVSIDFLQNPSLLGNITLYRNSKTKANEIPVTGNWRKENDYYEYRILGVFHRTEDRILLDYTFDVMVGGIKQTLTYEGIYTFQGPENVCPNEDIRDKGLDLYLTGDDLGDFFQYGSLKIEKKITGGTPEEKENFTFQVTGPLEGDEKTQEVIISGEGYKTLTDLPVGTYRIVEKDSRDYYAVEGSKQITLIKPDGKVTQALFTNFYYGKGSQAGGIIIEKEIQGLPDCNNQRVRFTLEGPQGEQKEVEMTPAMFAQGKASYGINGLAPGIYRITEIPETPEGYLLTNQEDTLVQTVEVKQGETTAVPFVNVYEKKEIIPDPKPPVPGPTPGGNASVFYQVLYWNGRDGITLGSSKVVQGASGIQLNDTILTNDLGEKWKDLYRPEKFQGGVVTAYPILREGTHYVTVTYLPEEEKEISADPEEKTEDKKETAPEPQKKETTKKRQEAPQTGDRMQPGVWVLVMLGAAGVCLGRKGFTFLQK